MADNDLEGRAIPKKLNNLAKFDREGPPTKIAALSKLSVDTFLHASVLARLGNVGGSFERFDPSRFIT